MARAAIYVQPSFSEGLSLALQEGMYYGCACVATRIPGNTELIDAQISSEPWQSGLVTPPGDTSALAKVIALLMADDGTIRRGLGENAHDTIIPRQMAVGHMLQNYKEQYESVAESTAV